MEVKQYVWDVVDSNSWFIVKDFHGLLIDAVDNEELFEEIKKLSDLTVILTHSHFDHIIGLNKIRELNPNVTVVSTEKCSEYLSNIHRNMSSSASAFLHFYEDGKKGDIEIAPFVCASAQETFANTKTFTWYGHSVTLKAVYGHSDDGLIVILDEKLLFSGDTLLALPTVTRFITGSKKRFQEEDLPLLASLANIEVVFPGHGKRNNLKDLLKINNVQILKDE